MTSIRELEKALRSTTATAEQLDLTLILAERYRVYSIDRAKELSASIPRLLQEWSAPEFEVRYLLLQANLYIDSAEYAAAEELLLEVEKQSTINSIPEFLSKSFMGMGTLKRMQGNIDAAKVFFEKARRGFEGLEALDLTAASIINYGVCLSVQGKQDEALEEYTKAIEICDAIANEEWKASALTNVAQALYQSGKMVEALATFDEAITACERTENIKAKGNALNNKGNLLSRIADYPNAFEAYLQALDCRQTVGDKQGEAGTLGNIGGLLYLQRKYDDAILYHRKALASMRLIGDKIGELRSYVNIGTCYKMQKIYPVALELYTTALEIAKEIHYEQGMGSILFNIGLVHESLLQLDSAVDYMNRAYSAFEAIGYQTGSSDVLQSLGTIHISMYDEGNLATLPLAEKYLLDAQALFEKLSMKSYLSDNYKYLHEVYIRQSNFEQALNAFKEHYRLEREVYSEDNQRRIDLLHTQHGVELLKTERAVTDKILHNILPSQIADRLKNGEQVIADSSENVTVLFADIVGFTKLSAKVPAEKLVRMLNDVFHLFDELAGHYGLEKIKTIGDCYMVVGGLPEQRDDHAQAVIRMGLEMTGKLQTITLARESNLNIRIGIHTGEVVAGVIGKRKFAYDLWGDTVNTASRMESHGEAGRVHISEAVYELVKHDFTFQGRGEIEVKGKGKMRTWFVENLSS